MQDAARIVEIPESVRNVVKSNIEQSKKSFDTILSTGQKTLQVINTSPVTETLMRMAILSTGQKTLQAINTSSVTETLMRLGDKVAEHTRRNAEANFQYAIKLADAKQLSDAVELQSNHMGDTVERITKQFEELHQLMSTIVKQTITSAIPGE